MTIYSLRAVVLSLTLFAVPLCGSCFATLVSPGNLGPGDQYRIAFVTTATTDATNSSISYYNNFVNSVANDTSTGGNLTAALNHQGWTAIVSTTGVDARDNTSTVPGSSATNIPIFLVDGTTIIANSYTDLWDGTLGASLNRRENNTTVGAFPWTGTTDDGTGSGSSTLGNSRPFHGHTTSSNMGWIETATTIPSTSLRPVYAISGVLTVSVPELGSASYCGLMLLLAVAATSARRFFQGVHGN